MVSAMNRSLGTLSPATPRTLLSHRSRLSHARSPSLHIAPRCDFHARRRHALLWIRLPPDNFCNFTSDARTRPRASDFRDNSKSTRSTRNLEFALALASPVTEPQSSPLEEEPQEPRTMTVLSKPPLRHLQAGREHDLES